jgi:hypothetical protein|tara:strand:- start:738 stop:935 length:198 start_codon:yes stop_codon:yes gene_type:complete
MNYNTYYYYKGVMNMKNKIIKEIEKGTSTNAIVGMFLSKRFDYDDIVKIIRDYKWEQFRRYGRRF